MMLFVHRLELCGPPACPRKARFKFFANACDVELDIIRILSRKPLIVLVVVPLRNKCVYCMRRYAGQTIQIADVQDKQD